MIAMPPVSNPTNRPSLAGRYGVLGAITAAVLAAGALFVRPWEGRELAPYRDIVGILTVCYGHTGADIERRLYSDAECAQILQTDLARHWQGLALCIHRPITVHQGVALLSWAYNIGVSRACRSTLVHKLNAGKPPSDWCQELLKWDMATNERVRGLTNRRRAELQECLTP